MGKERCCSLLGVKHHKGAQWAGQCEHSTLWGQLLFWGIYTWASITGHNEGAINMSHFRERFKVAQCRGAKLCFTQPELWVRPSPSQETLPGLSWWLHSSRWNSQLKSAACEQPQSGSEASSPAKTNSLNTPTAVSTDGHLPTRTTRGCWYLILLSGFWFMVSNAFNTWVFPLTSTTQPHLSLRKLTVDSLSKHRNAIILWHFF